MFVEWHILQNFAPSNLNRDDTGAPKDCEFGGFRRARISSQCQKRAMREYFRDAALIGEAHRAVRTKRLVEELLAPRLAAARGVDRATAEAVAWRGLSGLKLAPADETAKATQYLVFVAPAEVDRLAEACLAHWDALAPTEGSTPEAGSGRRSRKAAGQGDVPKELVEALRAALDGGRAVDLALFGRMLADVPERNVDGCCQVAHAISTNRVSVEFDFYTAVDDLRPEDTTGAGMLGTVEFNSACYYRYLNVDVDGLRCNLGGDGALVEQALRALLRAAVDAVPTGKQNSFAAQSRPSLVLGVVRERGLASLANAFVKPVGPGQGGLVEASTRALDHYWGTVRRMYGTAGLRDIVVCAEHPDALTELPVTAVVDGVDDVVERVVASVRAAEGDGSGVAAG